MLIANKLLPRGQGLAPALLKRAASVEIDWDLRQKSRFETADEHGAPLAVILPRGTVLRGGDVLLADDGTLRRVIAAKQPVMVVTACAEHGSPFDLMRAAYHLGNRHVALELQPERLQFEPDHVLAEMLRAMHLIVTETEAAFEPEGGAYAAGGHRHEGEHEPEAARGKPIGIAVKAAPAPHVHGPGCGHDHSH